MSFGLDKSIIENVINTLQNFPAIEEAIIYGSRVKGTFRTGSDIDITLKGKLIDENLINKISLQLDELLLPYKLDISVFHKISNEDLVEHINRVGISFYKKTN